jgi:hypothetical protein
MVRVGVWSGHQTAADMEPDSPLTVTVLIWSRRVLFTGVMSNPRVQPRCLAHSTCTGTWQAWHPTVAPPIWLQAAHSASYLARGIDGMPSTGHSALELPKRTSAVQTAQVT